MNLLSILLSIWAILIAAFLGMMIYRGYLTRQEADQLFLSELDTSETFIHEEQDAIVRRVNLLQPFCRGLGGAAAIASLGVIGAYLFQVMPYVRF